jgi:hypothetical protein
MTKRLTSEQHQMLEDLTGEQYTIFGVKRKMRRLSNETRRLGLVDNQTILEDKINVIITECHNHGIYDSDEVISYLADMGIPSPRIAYLIFSISSK